MTVVDLPQLSRHAMRPRWLSEHAPKLSRVDWHEVACRVGDAVDEFGQAVVTAVSWLFLVACAVFGGYVIVALLPIEAKAMLAIFACVGLMIVHPQAIRRRLRRMESEMDNLAAVGRREAGRG